MKMEIQKKIWTSRYEKRALTVAFVHTCALTACRDPGQARWPENSLDNVFFVFLVLNYRENYTFPRIQRGPNIFRCSGGGGGWAGLVQMLISIEPHITCDFPGGSGPYPPSGSAHEQRSSKN